MSDVDMHVDPEWIASDDANTPFGLVPPELQSYMKEVNTQLTERMHSDDTEEVHMLMQAALSEMDGHELSLATDPACSLVLENMASMLEEKPLRVLLDRMTGNFVTLARHRYGSHVLQALLYSVQRVVSAGSESRSKHTEHGVLRSLPDIVQDMYEEVEPCMLSMITEAFASHTLRSVIALLSGVPASCFDDLRSKRSAKYRSKERQKAMVDDSFTSTPNEPMHVDPSFLTLLLRLYEHIKTSLTIDQLHAFAADPTAAPTLSMLLRLEAALPDGKHRCMAWREDSMISRILGPLDEGASRSDFMESALRDAVATHVLESALAGTTQERLVHFWRIYIEGRVAKLGAHPCANFVVAIALRHLPAQADGRASSAFAQAVHELGKAGDQLVKNQVLGVLQTAIERSVDVGAYAAEVMHAIKAAFRFADDASEKEVALFVPVVLSLHTLKAYTHVQEAGSTKPAKRKRGEELDDSKTWMTTQGSVLLQRMALLPAPHQVWLYESLCTDALGEWCRSPTAAHVVIAALTSKAASFAQRRTLIRALMPMLLDLCDDTWGSRVADALWLAADGFSKDKILQLVLQHEKKLLASAYGRFFVRRLHVGMYRKNVDEWKAWAMEQTVPDTPRTSAERANPFAHLRTTKIQKSRTLRDQADAELDRIFSQVA